MADKEKKDPGEQMELVRQRLNQAKEHGMEAEVVYYALIEMQRNVAITPSMAMDAGIDEWDC